MRSRPRTGRLHALPPEIDKYADQYKPGWDKLRSERHQRQLRMGLADPKWGLTEWPHLEPSRVCLLSNPTYLHSDGGPEFLVVAAIRCSEQRGLKVDWTSHLLSIQNALDDGNQAAAESLRKVGDSSSDR